MTDALMKRDMHTGRTPCENEDKDQGDVSTSQGMPKIDHKPPETRRETWNRSFSHISQKKPTLKRLDLRLPASRTVRQYISVV